MNKTYEIGAYVLGGIAALAVGFAGASALFGNGDTVGSEPAAARTAPPPESAEVRNDDFRFSFRYPKAWGSGPRYHTSVRESVGQRDGVFCYVSVVEQKVASDESGRPKNLRKIMSELSPRHIEKAPIAAKISVTSFGRATLGGEDARYFMVDAKAQDGDIKMHGLVTVRGYGAIFLVCVAPADRFSDPGVQAAFRLAHGSFAFVR